MEEELEIAEVCWLWVDWEHRVISFHQAPGFERLEYPTRREMLEFAMEKSRDGFSIQ